MENKYKKILKLKYYYKLIVNEKINNLDIIILIKILIERNNSGIYLFFRILIYLTIELIFLILIINIFILTFINLLH